jgi:hypothetical protein
MGSFLRIRRFRRFRLVYSIAWAGTGLLTGLLAAWMTIAVFNALFLVPGDPSSSAEHNTLVQVGSTILFASLAVLFAVITRWAVKKISK